jgi:hypothetical protein
VALAIRKSGNLRSLILANGSHRTDTLPPSSRPNFALPPCCPQTEQELFKRRLLDRERNLRGVGNFHQPSLASTNVTQQADRIEARKPSIADNPPHDGTILLLNPGLIILLVGPATCEFNR